MPESVEKLCNSGFRDLLPPLRGQVDRISLMLQMGVIPSTRATGS